MPTTQDRVLRVFVSSTFRDMVEERDELAKRTFLQLRKLCEDRGVAWGEVDLRWGITDEQKAEGQVLPICLEEIRRCRPYFVGLLGERYGWVPDEIPDELVEREPWLAEHRHRSVTELEILHGVLNDPDMAEHAFFYFRSPAYIDSLPQEMQRDYREEPCREEVERLGPEAARESCEERKQKLVAVKDRIRASGLPVREGYADPEELARLVLEDLTGVIDRLFPEESIPDPLDREAAEHEAFAASRCGVYIGRQEYFDRLDEHARSDEGPLVVLGESGSGKSALLANWAERYRQRHPDDPLILRFIGASPHSADWMAMLRRILGELQRLFGIELEVPDQPDALRQVFANALHMAAARGRVVLLLDALNQLEDRDQAPDLVWLPPAIPANVRLVLTTLPGRPLDDLTRREWPSMRVEPLRSGEREELIAKYLAQYTKSLATEHVAEIAGAPQAANPLFLRVLLEELRLYGDHFTLGRKIAEYLEANTVEALYRKILERYAEDYERERPGLVRDAMSLLWAARRGLSESELLDLLGADGEPLPRARWSWLHLAAEQALVSRSGLIGFGHDYLRQAVGAEYLPAEEQRARHVQLADYFGERDIGSRKVDELPWQLSRAEEWQRLHDLLADLPFFAAAWEVDPFEVKAYWARVEEESSLRLVDAYGGVIEEPAEDPRDTLHLSTLLRDTGHPVPASKLSEHHLKHYRATGHSSNLSRALCNQAEMLRERGDLDAAMALHEEAEQICRELGDKDGLQRTLSGQAGVLFHRGDLEESLALYKEQEKISRELGDKDGLQVSLFNQALILKARGDLDGAMALHEEAEPFIRELGHKAGLSASLGAQANILDLRGDLDGAMALCKEQERICRELGYKKGLSVSLGNQALILKARGEFDGAMALHKEEERICRELGDKVGLPTSLGNQALILRDLGDLDGAMALLKEGDRIRWEVGSEDGLEGSLGNQALILKDQGDLDGAMTLLKEQENICRKLGYKKGLSVSLGNQALILSDRGELDGAMALHKEEERICRELGNRKGLGISLGNQAPILEAQGDLDGAMVLYKKTERIFRELGDKKGLSISLGSQAVILHLRGDLDEAMALYKQQERLCLELGNPVGLALSLVNQADLLAENLHRPQEALPLAEEALDLALEHEQTALAGQIKTILDSVRSMLR